MAETMTPRERWLAALAMEPVDRLPFWPKLDGAYPKAQAEPFRAMEIDAIHDWIGSDPHTGIAAGLREVRAKTSVETTRADGTMRTVFRTPHGEMALVCRYDGPSHSWPPVEFPVKTPGDIALMREVYEDTAVEADPAGLEQARAQARRIGEGALTFAGIGESPLMHWVEWLAGVERAHLLLLEYPGEVEALFAAMHAVLVRKTELLCAANPADALYMVENTSTTLISPDQYRRYCARHVGEYARIAREAGRTMILHMCGHLKALLPQLAAIPARAFEAFTSPPLGNTTLCDGRGQCPDKCLIGGTNAILWIRPAGEIIAQLEKDLDDLPHHRGIVVTSAGVMPPLCPPETIKEVCAWVKHYPARMGAA